MYRSRQLQPYYLLSSPIKVELRESRNKNVEDVYILLLILEKIIIIKKVAPEREENIFISTFGRRFLPLFFKRETRACYLSYKIALREKIQRNNKCFLFSLSLLSLSLSVSRRLRDSNKVKYLYYAK